MLNHGPQERHWAAAGIAAAIIGAAVSGYSAYAASEAQGQAADYNKKIARNQAQIARDAAATEIATRQDHYNRFMATQRNRIAGSGVDITEGSPLLVQMDQAEQAQLDLARVRYTGETRSTAFGSEANLQRFYGAQARRSGYLTASGSLLTGFANAAGAYARSSLRKPAASDRPYYTQGPDYGGAYY